MIQILKKLDRLCDQATSLRVNVVFGILFCIIIASMGINSQVYQAKFWKPEDHLETVLKYCIKNKLDCKFVLAVIQAESGGNPRAVSKAGAKGLMQIMPITQRDICNRLEYPKGDLFDPDYNIKLGTAYLRILNKRFKGNRWLVLAGYNMGPTRVAKLRKKYPGLTSRQLIEKHGYKETRAYCRKILNSKYLR